MERCPAVSQSNRNGPGGAWNTDSAASWLPRLGFEPRARNLRSGFAESYPGLPSICVTVKPLRHPMGQLACESVPVTVPA